MKNKKGFTLLELIAVIIVLAVIALITVSVILGVIENARKSAAKDAALGYFKAIEINNSRAELNGKYIKISDGTDIGVDTISVKIKGDSPESGTVTISKGRVTQAVICITGYTVEYENNQADVVAKCGEERTTIKAENVTFTPSDPNWKVNNVKAALDDLYS